jgi:hypothetical protein
MLYIPGTRQSLSDYLLSGSCHWSFGGDSRERMIAADIQSLPQLLKWARERYPAEFRNFNWWNNCTGKEATEKLWAGFLRWRDDQHDLIG